MRFIHTADWHLGRLFYGRHLTDDQAYILEQFQTIVKETRPDAVLISGDIYDRAVPPVEAVGLLNDTLSKLLLDVKVPVIMIAGNHDSPERVGFGSRLLEKEGLYVKGSLTRDFRPVVLDDAYGCVYFMPYTYAEPVVVRHLWQDESIVGHEAALRTLVADSLRALPKDARKVALSHAFIAGGGESESERPLAVGASGSVSAAVFDGFHYTALGHLHNAQQAGRENIRYAGSLMKYSFDEVKQKKGVEIIELGGDGAMHRETAALTPKYDVCRIEGYFDEILHNRDKYPKQEDYVSVALKDTQAILDVHGQLVNVYPNLMQVERLSLHSEDTPGMAGKDYRTKGEQELFADFFSQMTGEALTEAQSKAFGESYDTLLAKRREAKG